MSVSKTFIRFDNFYISVCQLFTGQVNLFPHRTTWKGFKSYCSVLSFSYESQTSANIVRELRSNNLSKFMTAEVEPRKINFLFQLFQSNTAVTFYR